VETLIETVLLGIIEGITEFLPISSTGHLLIAEHWLGRRSDLFNIAIQAGAILAVVLIYWRRLLELSVGFLKPENRDYALKLGAAFLLTCAGGLLAKRLGLELPETVTPIAWALIVGGFVIFAIESYVARPMISAWPIVRRLKWAMSAGSLQGSPFAWPMTRLLDIATIRERIMWAVTPRSGRGSRARDRSPRA